jgi:hypothetical protein
MFKLYEDNQLIGDIKEYDFYKGSQKITNVRVFSDLYKIQGIKEQCIMIFSITKTPKTFANHMISDENGNEKSATIQEVKPFNNQSNVKALVRM